MKCSYHPEAEAVKTCCKCNQSICVDCYYITGTHPVCRTCWDAHAAASNIDLHIAPIAEAPVKEREEEVGHTPDEIIATLSGGTATATLMQDDPESMIEENTSGQGSYAEVPYEIEKWNWGAFLLNWIWGIGNGVWISLLMFVPFVNFIMPFVLGAKGSKMAWQNRRWESVEHFQKTQKTWMYWGLGLFAAGLILSIVMMIIQFSMIGFMSSTMY